jgi:spermidine/putrescine-binding protein
MNGPRIAFLLAMALILGVPFALRPAHTAAHDHRDAPAVVIITPHVAQIRYEFERGFKRWHDRVCHTPVRVIWLCPGGTSEIVKQLQAKYAAAVRAGEIGPDGSCAAGTIPIDLMMGGGSFDHGRLKAGEGVSATVTGADGSSTSVSIPMSVPAGFTKPELDAVFGDNTIGVQNLYDPEQYWIGTALSGFGVVYNKDLLRELDLPEPQAFEDLCQTQLAGWVALADPRQSGSITTTFDAILSHYGWEKGWRVLREMCANTRYFTNQSTKPPIDVGQGEAAMGLAIDFYGRNQAQAVTPPGEDPRNSRVGYIDPKGSVYIDADPASILRGGPRPDLAKRFIEFCLTEEGQALWQFRPATGQSAGSIPAGAEAMGPERYALRRMPVRRVMYEKYWAQLMDQVNPFELATRTKPAGWRSALGIMMGAFAIDTADEQRQAWKVLRRARQDPNIPAETLAEMEHLFYSFPSQQMPDGKVLEFTPTNYGAIRSLWKDPATQARCKIAYTRFFRDNYARIVELDRSMGRLKPRV